VADRKRVIIIGLCIALVALTIALSFNLGGGDEPVPIGMVRVKLAGKPYLLELATDPASRELGLMGRTSIPPRGGMIFVFPSSEVRVQGFWMKNCPIDMDIVFLDPVGVVTAAHHMKAMIQAENESDFDYETRCRAANYSSMVPAQFAIELQAGSLERLNLKPGDKIPLDLDQLKGKAR
jgi:uncharacterized membrane protein (UPF0127 family)